LTEIADFVRDWAIGCGGTQGLKTFKLLIHQAGLKIALGLPIFHTIIWSICQHQTIGTREKQRFWLWLMIWGVFGEFYRL